VRECAKDGTILSALHLKTPIILIYSNSVQSWQCSWLQKGMSWQNPTVHWEQFDLYDYLLMFFKQWSA